MSDQTFRQRAGLRRLIERRAAPALPRDRFPVVTTHTEAQRGYSDAGMGMLLPQSSHPDYLSAWSDRKQEADCCASVQS